MNYARMPIEIESPEQLGYDQVKFNLTESSFRDARLGDLGIDLSRLLLCYGDHRGHLLLRELLAAEARVGKDDVLVTVGAAAALFIVATSTLREGDRILVVRPNYATNIETPRAIGAHVDFHDLHFEERFRLDVVRLLAAIWPEAKIVSSTRPQHPAGTGGPITQIR